MNALSLEQIRESAPSVFATEPWEKVSDRYAFIPTSHMVEHLLKEGFNCVHAAQAVTRDKQKKAYAKHVLRFRAPQHPDHTTWNVGDLYPEIILENSHDLSCLFRMTAGFFRLWCSNGCAAPFGNRQKHAIRHLGDASKIIDVAYRVLDDIPLLGDKIAQWQNLPIPGALQHEYAQRAIGLRWDADHVPFSPSELLKGRRIEDYGDDLFLVYQRVQENLIRAGQTGQVSGKKPRKVRGITSIKADLDINKRLWTLTEEMEKQLVRA